MNTRRRQAQRSIVFLGLLYGGTLLLSWGLDPAIRVLMLVVATGMIAFTTCGENWHEQLMARAFRLRRACAHHGAGDDTCCLRHRAHYEPIGSREAGSGVRREP